MTNSALQPGEHRAEIRGASLRYVVRGSGPVLVVQPGGAGWGGDISPYLETFGQLEIARTVVFLEPRGLGQSERRPGPTGYTIAEYVADLEAFRIHLGLERFELFGHSHGGFVALTYAAQFQARVERLILVGTTPTLLLGDREAWLATRPGYPEAVATVAAISDREEISVDERLRASLEAVLPILHFHRFPTVAATFERLVRAMTISAVPFQAFLDHEAAEYDIRGLLGRITAPTLVVAGDDEMPEMAEGSRLLAQKIPNAMLVVLDQCGHWPMLESPLHFFASVNGFLG